MKTENLEIHQEILSAYRKISPESSLPNKLGLKYDSNQLKDPIKALLEKGLIVTTKEYFGDFDYYRSLE